MGNNVEKPTGQSLALATITILIILLVNIFTKGFIKSISILIGLIAGTIIAATMGLVDFSPVAEAPLVHIPTPFYFGAPQFENIFDCYDVYYRYGINGRINWCISCPF